MKRFFNRLMKALLGGIIALAVLCVFCLLYYNIPVHYPNPDGSTEYKWETDTFYSKGTEGFALGVTNSDGFNNLRDYSDGESIDILLMGSSHMEGFNVAQDENAAAVLNTLFGGDRYTYNIGTAGHTMLYCIKHLDAALENYAPTGYVIIETCTVNFSPELLTAAANGTLPDIPSNSGFLVTLLQKIPYLRLAYLKLTGSGEGSGDLADAIAAEQTQIDDYYSALRPVLVKMSESCERHGVTPVIVYDPTVVVDGEGRPYTATDPDCLGAFTRLSDELGFIFVDLTESYLTNYEQTFALPYGFANTTPGIGHMNRIGHRLFAEETARAILAAEG